MAQTLKGFVSARYGDFSSFHCGALPCVAVRCRALHASFAAVKIRVKDVCVLGAPLTGVSKQTMQESMQHCLHGVIYCKARSKYHGDSFGVMGVLLAQSEGGRWGEGRDGEGEREVNIIVTVSL